MLDALGAVPIERGKMMPGREARLSEGAMAVLHKVAEDEAEKLKSVKASK